MVVIRLAVAAHRFGSLCGCACARSEAVSGRPHLSGLQRGERYSDLPGRETGAARVAGSCGPSAKEYLAAELRCCAIDTTTVPVSLAVAFDADGVLDDLGGAVAVIRWGASASTDVLDSARDTLPGATRARRCNIRDGDRSPAPGRRSS